MLARRRAPIERPRRVPAQRILPAVGGSPDEMIYASNALTERVPNGQCAPVRCGPTRVSFIGVLAICGLAVSGCADDVESRTTTAISTTGPLVGLRDGDVRDVPVGMESGESRLIATANGRAVSYRPTEPGDPDNICA